MMFWSRQSSCLLNHQGIVGYMMVLPKPILTDNRTRKVK